MQREFLYSAVSVFNLQEIRAEFALKGDKEMVKTKAIAGTNNPDWKLEKQYDFPSLTEEVS